MDRIPAHARLYIQHLRNVKAEVAGSIQKQLRGEVLGWRSMSLADCLSPRLFPSLKSCSVWEWSSLDAPAEVQQAVARLGTSVHILEKQQSLEWAFHVAQVYALMFGATNVRRVRTIAQRLPQFLRLRSSFLFTIPS